MSSPSSIRSWVVPLGGGARSYPGSAEREGEQVRLRRIASACAIVAIVGTAAPAHANVGTTCSAWRTTKTGGHQAACTVRSANREVAARGRGYYDGPTRLTQLNISVSLQSSLDGTTWTTLVSRTCGFADVPSSPPGGACLTPAQWV